MIIDQFIKFTIILVGRVNKTVSDNEFGGGGDYRLISITVSFGLITK